MNVLTFTSATGNNMTVVHEVLKQRGHRGVALNVSDVADCGAVGRARRLRIPTLVYAPAIDGKAPPAQRRAAQRAHHDALAQILVRWEQWNGPIHLIVLAYHRFIEGDLLTRYAGRIVNQHPGDLTVKDPSGRRALVGMHAVRKAYKLGLGHTRSCTILVNECLDGGPIIARGPSVTFDRVDDQMLEASLTAHENRQKVKSDSPCLAWVIDAFVSGSLSIRDHRGAPWPHLNGAPISDAGHSVTDPGE